MKLQLYVQVHCLKGDIYMRDYKKTLTFTVKDEGILRFGQRVYVVAETCCKTFKEKCPVCDSTGKINVRGYEFDCPYCRSYSSRSDANAISVHDYEADEYIINNVEIRGEDVKCAYKTDGSIADERYPYVKYKGFSPSARRSWSKTKEFSGFNFERRDPDKPLLPHNIDGEYSFLQKAEALKFIKRIHERQAELLEKFNAEHGTDHEYPFKY